MEKPYVVISDLHASIQKLVEVLKHYGNDYDYIFNGDLIDRGRDSKSTLEIVRSMGDAAIVLTGNHEWVLRAALTDADPQRRAEWRDYMWLGPSAKRCMESRMLESYGVVTDKSNEHIAKTLRQRMYDAGHLELIENSLMYFENEELLVIHAGTDNGRTWQNQRADLDTARSLAQNHIFQDEPGQIFDFKYSDVTMPPRDIWNKTLITGHTHLRKGAEDRIWWGNRANHPTRVRLASHLVAGDPLFVYETDSQEIRAF